MTNDADVEIQIFINEPNLSFEQLTNRFQPGLMSAEDQRIDEEPSNINMLLQKLEFEKQTHERKRLIRK